MSTTLRRTLPVLATLLAALTALGAATSAGPATTAGAAMPRATTTSPPVPGGSGGGNHRDDPDDGAEWSRDEVRCRPGRACVASPEPGEHNVYRVRATGGRRATTLVATLNGREDPDCAGYRERSYDWIHFRFSGGGGSTWAKTVTMTWREPLEREEAREALARRQVCFAAPYRFTVREGFRLTRDDGAYLGVLPNCKPGGPVRPCLAERTIVRSENYDGWLPRLVFSVPPSAQDPRGRS